ncbi:MAG: DUF2156 domain-containing protein [Desulfobacteraceae bacterium]|nr:DUF2156 domain-containing protein [Desulfobacteraceae bacterium]
MHSSDSFEFNEFVLKDIKIIQQFVDTFKPLSCEYNFSNLFCWQNPAKLSWTLYQNRLLVYDNIDQCAFMPLGEKLPPKELAELSKDLQNIGLKPDFSIVSKDYIKGFPEIENYYTIKEEPDYAEYIYDVNSLCDLKGKKLSKKRNLISQFKRLYPDFEVHMLKDEYKYKARRLAQELMKKRKKSSKTLDQEFCAIETSFDHFDQLGLDGLVVMVGEKMVAFSVFSELNHLTYDIQFEKSDMDFKGAAQVINQETAKFLKDRCQYLNREQDLGIKGLRQAKMSYDPVELITPYSLTFTPAN